MQLCAAINSGQHGEAAAEREYVPERMHLTLHTIKQVPREVRERVFWRESTPRTALKLFRQLFDTGGYYP